MVKRSLKSSVEGIQIAKKAFTAKGWTQDNLAFEVGIKTRQPVWRFFTGKPVDRHIFMEFCSILEIDWREIALDPPAEFKDRDQANGGSIDINDLVKQVRSQRYEKIKYQCGSLNLIEVNRSVDINDIYIDVNILEKIASKQWLEITDLQNIDPDQFNRFGMGDIAQSQIPGVTAVQKYNKLRVLGKPGIGKTTFLQHLAIESNEARFAADQVPIFISMQRFMQEAKRKKDFSLLNYIIEEFADCGISNPDWVETLFQKGRILLLMDGLDEVLNQDSPAMLKEIRRLSESYFKNQFVATCRTASQKLSLQGYTDVEVAPFTIDQIIIFAQKWFISFSDSKEGKAQSAEFIRKLQEPVNWKFQRMVNTPLFLHLACWVFLAQQQFPTKLSEFYKQGLDLLLGKWDEIRGIERDEIYRNFLLPQKLKLFSQIASTSFEEGRYFFAQPQLEAQVGEYLSQLPNASIESEDIKYDSNSVIRAIESQHGLLAERARGIFSFSYLAFHEYFTARMIVANYNLMAYGEPLEGLVSHINEPRWREIFLLTASMLRSADGLMQLMKKRIDNLLRNDSYLQEFLSWATQKSVDTPSSPKIAAVRAFYLALSQSPHVASQFALASTLEQGMILDTSLDDLLQICSVNQDIVSAHNCDKALGEVLITILDVGLNKSLEQLHNQVPPNSQKERFKHWWKEHYQSWVEELRLAISSHRNINHPWTFSPEQQLLLENYYDANQLLLDCLATNCEVTIGVRSEIEATLLLPQKDLEIYEWR